MSYSLEYVWLDKNGNPRSKVKILPKRYNIKSNNRYIITLDDCPKWNFDGSSTGQSKGKNTEIILKPVRVYVDPFYTYETHEGPKHWIVLCQLDMVYDDNFKNFLLKNKHKDNEKKIDEVDEVDGEIVPWIGLNTRYWAKEVADRFVKQGSWFGVEQEYCLLDTNGDPIGGKEHNMEKQGKYYCSVGFPYCQMNDMVREHADLCKKMNIMLSGINAEVSPGQWEFQVGPGDLLRVADDLIIARYVLYRLSNKYKVRVELEPKPIEGDFNGSGCHINFSTKKMRDDKNMVEIEKTIDNLSKCHKEILQFYGENNIGVRLTGKHETSSPDVFSYGIGTRDTSLRIPNIVADNKMGYIEDRRPASNIDPYLALGNLLLASQTGKTVSEIKA